MVSGWRGTDGRRMGQHGPWLPARSWRSAGAACVAWVVFSGGAIAGEPTTEHEVPTQSQPADATTSPDVDAILEIKRRLGLSLPIRTDQASQEALLKQSLIEDSHQPQQLPPLLPSELPPAGAWPQMPLPQMPTMPQPQVPTNLNESQPWEMDAKQMVWQLRKTSSQLDQLANQLEYERRYTDADQLRQLAQRLRVEARQRDATPALEPNRAQPTSWEPPTLRQPTPPPDASDFANPLAPYGAEMLSPVPTEPTPEG